MKKNNKQKIKENPSFTELIKPVEGLNQIINNPFIKFAFPDLKLYEFEDKIKKIYQEANELTTLPDKFNETFENTGWFMTSSIEIDIVKEALSTAKLVLNEIARISKDAQGLRADMLQKVHQLTESIEAFEVPRIPVVSYINDKDKEQDEPVDIQI